MGMLKDWFDTSWFTRKDVGGVLLQARVSFLRNICSIREDTPPGCPVIVILTFSLVWFT